MYFVRLFKNGSMFLDAPFEDKTSAIKYFNMRVDISRSDFLPFDSIEIASDDGTVLFDYEV